MLDKGFREGLSMSQISKTLVASGFAFSRNAVIGKLHRTGRTRNPTSAKVMQDMNDGSALRKRMAEKAAAKPAKVASTPPRAAAPPPMPPAPPAAAVAPEPTPPLRLQHPPIGILALTSRTCRWPVNDGAPEWLFCGAPAPEDESQPYCPCHAGMARSPHQPKRPERPPREGLGPLRAPAQLGRGALIQYL